MDKYDCLKLDNQLCFPLYACSREIVRQYTPYLEPLGLTYTQYITLMALWEHRMLSVKDMGKLLHLDSGTLTPVLKALEKKGLVTRARGLDRRNLDVTLTEAGEALKERAVEVPAKVGGCLEIDMEDTVVLSGILNKMLKTF